VRPLSLVWCLSIAASCFGAETVFLTNGFTLQGDSHKVDGNSIIIYSAGGTLQFPASLVARIETLPDRPDVSPDARKENHPAALLSNAAEQEGLEPELVRSVARVESGLRPDARSPKGAIGLMQLMPETAAELGAKPDRADSNALAGAKYLRELLLRYHGDYALALAAYNAGPRAVAKYHGIPPYSETVNYILRVLKEYSREKSSYAPGRAGKGGDSARLKNPNATN
jgi:hypothetical protein